jgi:AraC-like DNA-binding protein
MPDQVAHPRQRRERDGTAGGMPPSPSHVGRIATRHADEHHAWISARYTDHTRRLRARRRGFGFFAESAALGGLTATRTSYRAATVEITWPNMPFLVVCHLRSGRYLARWQGVEVRVADRGTMLFPPDEFVHLNDCADSFGVSLSMETLLRVAGETSGLDPSQMRFVGLLPISPTAERQWLATADYIQRGIYNRSLDQPLLLAAAEQMLAASALNTFPNTTMTRDVRRPRDPASATTVRRARAFIDAHAGRAITLTDIATAAGVVPRTLQYAFRRHQDTTPLGYLRRVRLAYAHAQLVAAEPGDGTTVAVVAARWGYARPTRFAAAYRELYGKPPAQTLRS